MDLVIVGHVVAVIVGLGAHGVSAFAMFAAKRETDRNRLMAVLDLSRSAVGIFSIALLVAIVLGIWAAVADGDFSRAWPWVSIVTLVVLIGLMTPLGGIPMNKLRIALGQRVQGDKPGDAPRVAGTDAEVAAAVAALKPELLTAVGIAAVVFLTWMMRAKPF